MKVVIDCNVFVMAVSTKSPYHTIVTSLMNGLFELHITTEIYFEIAEKIEEKFRREVAEAFLDAFNVSPYVVLSEAFYKWNIISRDEDDNKYIDCYIKSRADYLVSNDKHFNVLKEINFPKVNCVTIEEFIEILKGAQ